MWIVDLTLVAIQGFMGPSYMQENIVHGRTALDQLSIALEDHCEALDVMAADLMVQPNS
jgi:hypothetical protein